MKNTLLCLLMLFSCSVFAQEIAVPDANFKAKLLASSSANQTAKDNDGNAIAIDTNGDGIITAEEAHEVRELDVSASYVASLEGISYFDNLKVLKCNNNQLAVVNLSALTDLKELYISYNSLSTLDLSANTDLEYLSSRNNNLEILFIKNGSNESFAPENWNGNPDLAYICADASQIEDLTGAYNVPASVEVNSYCTFEPGGIYNKITGTVRYDDNNNGCDASDRLAASLRMKISNGIYEDDVFTKADGTYIFYAGTGSYTVTPDFEEEYFTALPEDATVNFTELAGSGEVRDFCIAASGSNPDLEVVMVPLSAANPGNDVLYKMVYKNKGNQPVSGTVSCNWNGSLFDFVSMYPMADVISQSVYSWDFTNLKPFECGEIEMTLNLNGAGDTPPVTVGNVLPFTMTVNAVNDVLPSDNTFVYNQPVTASPYTNTITCIQGNTASADQIGEYLHYVVNFENAGTAAADFVVVQTAINEDEFDLGSLRLINSSAPVQSRVLGNSVELRLDATMGVADHGNILYKIKTKKSLMAGATVTNSSVIYFGYNEPVNTNSAITTFAILGTGEFVTDASVKMYPNPSKGSVTIDASDAIRQIELYDIGGRLLQVNTLNNESATIDVSGRASGVYFMKIVTEKGIKVEKLIRE